MQRQIARAVTLPFASPNSVMVSNLSVAKGRDRWAAVVREASKQSVRPWLPDVLDLVTTKQLARLASTDQAEGVRMLVLEPTAATPLSALDFDRRDLVLVVGPEGGITPQELDALSAAGADIVRLGDEVLRNEPEACVPGRAYGGVFSPL